MGFLDPKPQTTAGLDAAVTAKINTPASAIATALSATIDDQIEASPTVTAKADKGTAALEVIRKQAVLGVEGRWAVTAFEPPPAVDVPVISKSVTAAAYTWTIASPTQHRPLRIPAGDTNPVDLAGDTKFRYKGVTSLVPNGSFNTFVNTSGYKPGGAAMFAKWPVTVEFETAATEIEFLTRANIANNPFGHLRVNGRWVQETDITHTNTAGQWLFTKLTFPDSRMRRIEAVLHPELAFFGVGVTTGFGVYRPKEPIKRRIAIVGDSFTDGAGGGAPGGSTITETYALRLAYLMGADEVILAGIGGTKWVAPGGTGDAALGHFAGRIPEVLAFNPHAIVFFGSRNDNPAAPAPIQTAVESTLDLVAAIPEVYVSGTASPGGGQWPINDAVKAGALAKGRPFIDLSRLAYGTGKLGAVTNDGNADQYIGTDGVHPTHDYQRFIARTFYLGIAGLYTSV